MIPRRRLELISGRSHPTLARDIAAHLGVELGEANLREFANGEIYCKYDISIRGCDVFIVQTHASPVNDSLMEHLIMIDAAKRASAKRITAVCPYYGYSRQDRKSTGREPITAKLVADMLSAAGADREELQPGLAKISTRAKACSPATMPKILRSFIRV